MFRVVCIRDIAGTTYMFQKTEKDFSVMINGEMKGYGKLITPLNQLSVMTPACFTIGEQNFKTDPIKGVFVD